MTAPNEAGNVASSVSPNSLREGTHVGSRDRSISVMKERAGFIRGLLQLDLPPAFRAKLQADQAALQPQLQRTVAIDWLTNVAWAGGARPELVNALDNARIEVVPDSELDSDASFDEQAGVVFVRASMVDKLDAEVTALAQKNVVDRASGAVLDAAALKHSGSYRQFVVAQALVGAHELSHAKQAAHGHSHEHAAHMQPLVANVLGSGPGADRAVAEAALVREYVDRFEYEAYAAQERYQFEMGAAPKSTSWMTIDNSGRPVDRTIAVDNIVRFLSRDGFDAGRAMSILGSLGHGVEGRGLPGQGLEGRGLPGRGLPGRGLPGQDLEGRGLPGRGLPGRGLPGEGLEGRGLPGRGLPGRGLPGRGLPGNMVE